jgi:serine/threonine-protein kinase SRPK3
VSVKIITADRTNKSRELHSLQALAEHSKGSLGSERIVQLLDDFLHEGPNGCHQCLVFELLGPTVNIIADDYHGEGERLDTETLLRISTQLLQAVAFMHEAGYAHGGIVVFLPPGRSNFLCLELTFCRSQC